MIKNNLIFLFVFFSISNLFSQKNIVSEVIFIGLKKTKPTFLKKLLSIKSNQQLDSIILENDIKFLKRLPAVANASYKVIPHKNDTYKIVFNIEENFTIIPSFNVYTSNNGEFAYRIGLSEFNLLGRNMIVGGFFQKDIYNSYGIHFKAPYLFSKKLGLSLIFQDLTTQEPVFFRDGTVNFKYNNVSFETLFMFEINSKNRIQAGVNFFNEDYEYKPQTNDVQPPLNKLITNKKLYKFIYDYDNVNYHYQYVSGFRNIFNYQYVTTSDATSSPKFSIAWNDILYYRRVGNRGNWACRLRVGLATNNNSPFAPFSVDNNVNIRGVGNTIDRGTGAIVLNTEYRHTLFEKKLFSLQGNAFIDSGSWRNPGGELNNFTNSDNIRVFSGMGVRFIHKKIFNAVFRIDYGFGITENTQGLVFGIGQYF